MEPKNFVVITLAALALESFPKTEPRKYSSDQILVMITPTEKRASDHTHEEHGRQMMNAAVYASIYNIPSKTDDPNALDLWNKVTRARLATAL
jgi:hypothetical protein